MVVNPDSARREPRCSECGYGLSAAFDPAGCPMCHAVSSGVADVSRELLADDAAWADADVRANRRFDSMVLVEVGPLEAAYLARQTALRAKASREADEVVQRAAAADSGRY